uniref:Uncharacterized protein n=1 Tax=Arundo donax TaxID=35708 RepID=A0A0A9AFH2_ARUDO
MARAGIKLYNTFLIAPQVHHLLFRIAPHGTGFVNATFFQPKNYVKQNSCPLFQII